MKKKMLATIAASVALVGASFAATTKTEAAGVTCPTANVYQVKYTSTNVQDFEKWLKQYFPFVSFQPAKPATQQAEVKQPAAAKPAANTQTPAKTPATAPNTTTQKTTG